MKKRNIKTYQDWEKSELNLSEFLSENDEIDYEIYEHILCEYCPPNYDDEIIGQCGEAWDERDGVFYYETVKQKDDKYFYLGILPDKNIKTKTKPEKSVKEELKIGDPVQVMDSGLLMFQSFAPKNSFPNNYGRISEIWEQDYLIEFPLTGGSKNKLGYDEHSQVAPYPKHLVHKRELFKKL
jgi:hypothetical protein